MDIKQSPLKLLDFAILNCTYKFVFPESVEEVDIKNIFSSYHIDMDYATIMGDNGNFRVFVKAAINNNEAEQKVGYAIFAEGAAIFTLPDDISNEDKMNLVNNAAVGITIGNLRSFISLLTSSSPLPKYNFPPIDMGDLIVQKIQKMEQAAKDVDNTFAKKGATTKKEEVPVAKAKPIKKKP